MQYVRQNCYFETEYLISLQMYRDSNPSEDNFLKIVEFDIQILLLLLVIAMAMVNGYLFTITSIAQLYMKCYTVMNLSRRNYRGMLASRLQLELLKL